MSDPSATQSQRPGDLTSLRDLVADVLHAIVGTLLVASGVLAVLILVTWVGGAAQDDAEPGFPGRYLLALLPMLAAAGWLSMYASSWRSGRS
jgi:hypothetical protein